MTDRAMPHRVPLDRTRVLQTLAIFIAFAVGTAGLHTVLQGAHWWVLCTAIAAVGLAVSLLSAALGIGRVLSAVFVAGAMGALLTIVFAADTALLGFIPTPGTAGRFIELLGSSAHSISWQGVPAVAGPDITSLIGIGVAVLVLLAHLAAFTFAVPAVVGVPLAAVFLVPSIPPAGSIDGVIFAATAACYLWLLLIGRPRQTAPATAIGVAAVIVALVLPGALPGVDLSVPASSLGSSVITGVNPVLGLGDDLRRGEERPALRYSTLSDDPHYLQLTTVQDFTGTNWGPDEPNLGEPGSALRFEDPPGLSPRIKTSVEVSYVTVANLWSPWLPIPYPTTRVTGLSGNWSWDSASLAVASEDTVARGQTYTATSLVLSPTPEQLQAAGTEVPAGLDRYLELPSDLPPIIGDTAGSVAAGAGSNYEKAIALQQYFRGGDFSYSEQTPVTDGYDGTGMQVVARFLEVRSGYCIHFASAMAVMARTLGIPSRIAVGFLPGTKQDEESVDRAVYRVSTHDLHTWPELYFDTIGWVPFEPTATRGVIPDYANQQNAGVPVPLPPSTVTPTRDPTLNDPGATPGSAGGQGTAAQSGLTLATWLTMLGILLAVVALVMLPAVIRLVRRRRCLAALRDGTGTAADAWREVVDTAADVGIGLAPILTPREMVGRIARAPDMTTESRDALERLRDAVERERFGKPAAEPHNAPGLAADLVTVVAALLAGTDGAGRVRARLLPASFLSALAANLAPSALRPRLWRLVGRTEP